MKLILVPVPYGIRLQNTHLMDADFSWLRHIPKWRSAVPVFVKFYFKNRKAWAQRADEGMATLPQGYQELLVVRDE